MKRTTGMAATAIAISLYTRPFPSGSGCDLDHNPGVDAVAGCDLDHRPGRRIRIGFPPWQGAANPSRSPTRRRLPCAKTSVLQLPPRSSAWPWCSRQSPALMQAAPTLPGPRLRWRLMWARPRTCRFLRSSRFIEPIPADTCVGARHCLALFPHETLLQLGRRNASPLQRSKFLPSPMSQATSGPGLAPSAFPHRALGAALQCALQQVPYGRNDQC